MSQSKDLTNCVFGRLTILGKAPHKAGRTRWRWRCSCGKEGDSTTTNLSVGRSTSCGCRRHERRQHLHIVRGASSTSEYKSWSSMKNRCLNPNDPSYWTYGGRGITICDEWKLSFPAFLRDMGPKTFVGATIDRKDTNGNYEPLNCKWSTRTQQNRNKRNTKLSEEKVTQIIALAADGRRHREIGLLFSVARSTVSKIVRGEMWAA